MLQTQRSDLLCVSNVLQVRQQEDGIVSQQRWERPRGPHRRQGPGWWPSASEPRSGSGRRLAQLAAQLKLCFNHGNDCLETGITELLIIRWKVWSGAMPGGPKWLPGVPSSLFSIRRRPLGEGRLPSPPEDRRVKTRLQTPLSSPLSTPAPL